MKGRIGIREETRAAVTLALAAPILTELFSANMSPRQLFNPLGFFLAGFIGYGAPVLLIRELAVRWRVGLPGLFLMGVAYGVFNEGIIAKTLFHDNPASMVHYPNFAPGGVQVVWAAMICTWHALHAVVFPIALVSLLYPRVRQHSWLGLPIRILLLAMLVIFGGLFCANARPEYATRQNLAGSFAVMALLFALATRLRSNVPFFEARQQGRGLQVGLGAGFYPIYFFGFVALAALGPPPWVVLLWPLALVLAAYLLTHRARWVSFVPVAYIALGDYTIGSFLNMLVNLGGRAYDKAAALLVLLLAFAIATAIALRRAKKMATADSPSA